MDTDHSVLKFARRFFAGTLLSRLSGGARDVTMAICFGSQPEIAAFMVAYRFANLVRTLFGEGSLQAGLIPHLSGLNGPSRTFFYRDFAASLLSILFIVISVIEGFLAVCVPYLGDNWKEIVYLSMRMMPGIVFICLYGLNCAFLQYHKRYFASSIAPILFNAVWIISSLWSRNWPILDAMRLLAVTLCIGFFFQWVLTLWNLRKSIQLPLKEWIRPRLFSGEFRKLIQPLSLSLIGVAAMQVNCTLDAVFARFAEVEGPAYLWYAMRVQQLPLALFGIALAGALLPSLSRAVSAGNQAHYTHLLKGSIRQAAALLIPCTVGIFALGKVGLNLLYGHGHFEMQNLLHTLHCSRSYAFGLFGSALTLLLSNAFYAHKLYWTPVFSSLISIGCHFFLNCLFVLGLDWGSYSIAISTSLSSWINTMILVYFMQRDLKVFAFTGFFPFLGKVCAVSLLAYLVTEGFQEMASFEELPRLLMPQVVQFLSSAGVFSLILFVGGFGMRIEELFLFFRSRDRFSGQQSE